MTTFEKKIRRAFIESDTNTVRVLIAIASFVYAVSLWLTPDLFKRDYWEPMRVFSEGTWAWIFFTHFIGVAWRQFDTTPRPFIAFLISAYGLLVWFVTTGMLTQHSGHFAPTNALEATMIFAGLVALIRTGLNDDKISP